MGVITEEARRWAEQDYPDYAFAVNERDIQKYAHAIGETDRMHFDREAAIEAGYDEIVAPPFFPYVIRASSLKSEIFSFGKLGSDPVVTPETVY